ncbi:hypothetical protein BGW36DRAFT_360548 [Talaromyces proteolyticus]|uniref:Uncharacterized protein n=1 Tax=Talaromyces proteolyticus TaxID=1131652 RepID=A0AAD4KNK8_9EURO|nr:uncharacterized protein BGW36DRAFT_360548 [Talaromyces proteolyticus]KAH8696733.1 hypothetical protein BGW36DRAFT_360548 [Talaromyces proteolyticus]
MLYLAFIYSITTLALLLAISQAKYCTSQGPGVCQLNFQGSPLYTDGNYKYSIIWEFAYIFDNSCKQLGYVTYPLQGLAIDSQLPFTVDITWMSTDTEYFEFCYSATCHQGGFWCQLQDVNSTSIIECLHGFDCANMERMVSPKE